MLLKNRLNNVKKLLKNDNVLTKLEERYCYSTDAANVIYDDTKIPDLVVFVETIEDVQKVLTYANKYKIPVVSRGAGTNMVGSCVCTHGGIVLNFSKMNKILEINTADMIARVQPGVVLGDLKTSAEALNLFFPPDPSNYKVSTIGGAIAQASAGASAFKYGTIKDYVLSLKVVTADGKLMTLGATTVKDTVGYHLNQLMVGSEGTLAVIVEATLKLIPKPECERTIAIYLNSFISAVSIVNKLSNSNIFPVAVDFMDNNSIVTVENYLKVGMNCRATCMLLVKLDANVEAINMLVEKTKKIIITEDVLEVLYVDSEEFSEKLWSARNASYAAVTRLAPDVVSDDVIVPRKNLLEILDFCMMIANKYFLKMCIVGHVADGNIHPQIALDLNDENQFKNYIKAKSEIYNKVLDLEGSISGEHGVGIEKLSFVENIIDKSALDYMKFIKKAFDPNNILNPGKIFKI